MDASRRQCKVMEVRGTHNQGAGCPVGESLPPTLPEAGQPLKMHKTGGKKGTLRTSPIMESGRAGGGGLRRPSFGGTMTA